MRICPICGKNPLKGRQRVCDSVICREEMRKSWYEEKIVAPEGYLRASEFAKKYGITPQAVTKNCRAGKYPGAFQDQSRVGGSFRKAQMFLSAGHQQKKKTE